MPEYLSQYETLRSQALESGGSQARPSQGSLEVAFVERQGLAAWMKHCTESRPQPPMDAADGATDPQTTNTTVALAQRSDLVLALVSLVLGNRKGMPHG